MRSLVATLTLLLLAAGAEAQTVTVDRIDVVSFGTFGIETGEITPTPDTPTGEVTAVSAARNLQSTHTIKAHVGLEFGFQYVVVGSPAGAEVTLDIVHRYPAQGLKTPESAEPVRESRYQRTKVIGETNYLGYGFEQEWEMEPGSWGFEIWYDGRRLAEETFSVER